MLTTDVEIGNIIKRKRLEKGLTQAELGQKMGVGKTAVAKWEAGKVKNLKRDSLPVLANILQISPLALIGISDADTEKVITLKKTDFPAAAFERIRKHIATVKENKECILVTQDEFTASQFEQIKNFIQFIKGNK